MALFSDYFKESHILSRIDARVKILAALAVLVMVLSYRGFALPLLVTSLCLFLSFMMRVPMRIFMLRFSEPVFIASIIILLKFFFSGSDILISFDIMGIRITGHKDGLLEGLMIAGRILGAVSIVAVMGFSTPFTEFIAGLSWLKIPRGFIDVLMFAYRYIFVLIEDATVIYNAQKNRLGYSNVRRGLSSFGTLAGSLVLRAFEHSNAITVSMVQRGYDGNMPMLKHKPFKPVEVIVSVLFITAMGFVWKIL
jgi:cobalt/nickel transport system permease protein